MELQKFLSQKPGFSITESFLKFVDLPFYRGFSLELNGPRMRIQYLLFALIPPCVEFLTSLHFSRSSLDTSEMYILDSLYRFSLRHFAAFYRMYCLSVNLSK